MRFLDVRLSGIQKRQKFLLTWPLARQSCAQEFLTLLNPAESYIEKAHALRTKRNQISVIFRYNSAMLPHTLSRRSFLAFSAMLPCALSVRAAKPIPVGLELYSVRDELKKDPEGTVRAVARSEEHTSELQSQSNLVCRLLLEKKK